MTLLVKILFLKDQIGKYPICQGPNWEICPECEGPKMRRLLFVRDVSEKHPIY